MNLESNLLSSLMIKGSSSFLIVCDIKSENVSEDMIKILYLLPEMISSAKFITKARWISNIV